MNMKLKFAAVAAVAVLSSSAMAAGFLNGEQSALGTGRAYAGAGVMGDDLSTVFANPAGMTALSGTRAQAGFHVFGTSFKIFALSR